MSLVKGGQTHALAGLVGEAHALVHGDREKAYGPPAENFALIAALWSAYVGADIDAIDAALMMALLKIARCKTGSAAGMDDSLTDLAGYAEVARRIGEETK